MVCAQFATCIQEINLLDVYCSHRLEPTESGFISVICHAYIRVVDEVILVHNKWLRYPKMLRK